MEPPSTALRAAGLEVLVVASVACLGLRSASEVYNFDRTVGVELAAVHAGLLLRNWD